MNKTELKKQIREINKRVAAGEKVEVALEDEKKSARLTVDAKGARRKRKSDSDAAALGINAAAVFQLDFGKLSEISDAEIVEKIKKASDLSQAAGAAA